MSLEQDLKETFMRHADDLRPDVESWPTVEKKVRRAHAQRITLASAAVVALIAATAIFVPRLGNTSAPHGFVSTSKTPTVATSTVHRISPVAGKSTYLDSVQGWIVQYPTDWNVQRYESGTDFVPRGLPSVESGRTTFSVVVSLEPGDYTSPFLLAGGAPPNGVSTTLAGVPATRYEVIDKSGHNSNILYQLDWSGRCAAASPSCTVHQMLVIWMSSYDRALWSRYVDDGLALARSFLPEISTNGRTGALRTRGGRAPSGFVLDDYGRSLIAFLDARTDQGGAEAHICCDAIADYRDLHGLYEYGGKIVTGYAIIDRTQVAPNKVLFGVHVSYDGGSSRNEAIEVDVAGAEQPAKIASMCLACGGV
jgi:hypothetical protein